MTRPVVKLHWSNIAGHNRPWFRGRAFTSARPTLAPVIPCGSAAEATIPCLRLGSWPSAPPAATPTPPTSRYGLSALGSRSFSQRPIAAPAP